MLSVYGPDEDTGRVDGVMMQSAMFLAEMAFCLATIPSLQIRPTCIDWSEIKLSSPNISYFYSLFCSTAAHKHVLAHSLPYHPSVFYRCTY